MTREQFLPSLLPLLSGQQEQPKPPPGSSRSRIQAGTNTCPKIAFNRAPETSGEGEQDWGSGGAREEQFVSLGGIDLQSSRCSV